MTTKIAALFALCLATTALTACGGDDSFDDDGDDVTTFDCDSETCDSAAGEFCWIQFFPNGEVSSSECFEPTTACTTCDCAADAVAERLDGASNCDGVVGCEQDGEAITYSCDNPPI